MEGSMILRSKVGMGEKAVSPYEDKLQYCGRMDFSFKDGPLWVYPCSYVRLRWNSQKCMEQKEDMRLYMIIWSLHMV